MKRWMKRGILLLLALAVLVVCAACGGGTVQESDGTDETSAVSTPTNESDTVPTAIPTPVIDPDADAKTLVQDGMDAYNAGDYEKVRECYELAIEKGNVQALNYLGGLYEYGQGVEQDYKKAMEYYQEAADKGNSQALVYLGSFYEYGKGDVAQDYEKALEYYEQAAEKGNEYAAEKVTQLREQLNG